MAHNPKYLRKARKKLKLTFKHFFKEKIDYTHIDADQFGFEQFHNIVDQYLVSLVYQPKIPAQYIEINLKVDNGLHTETN